MDHQGLEKDLTRGHEGRAREPVAVWHHAAQFSMHARKQAFNGIVRASINCQKAFGGKRFLSVAAAVAVRLELPLAHLLL